MKKSLIFMLLSIISAMAILIVLGFVYNKPEDEKQQGLTDVFDVSSDGTIAYVVFEKGKAGVHLKNDKEAFENPVVELNKEQAISDIDFSADGSSLAYIVINKDVKLDSASAVHLLTIKTLEKEELFKEQTLLTEIDFDPKDQNTIYYLRAETFENYSPIARANPHGLDLYSYRILDNKHLRHTEMSKYSMHSLNVSGTSNSAFLQMDDDANSETAEDIFASKQRIFEIPLDSSDAISVISQNDRDEDIFDFVIIPNKDELIFQSVGSTNKNGIFEYELFHYNFGNNQEKQLTKLKEYASRPVIGPQNEKVFFMVDKRFGKTRADYHLYQMDLDGKNVEEITLDLGTQ